jgi:hypothetical protein
MNKNSLIIPVGFALTATLHAQSSSPWSFRFGYSGLTNNASQALAKQDGITLGLGYDLPRFGRNLSIDANFDTHRGHGNKIDATSLMLVNRFPIFGGADSTGAQAFFGVGLGVANQNVKYSFTVGNGSGTTSTTTVSSNKYFGAGELLLGVRLDNVNSVELFFRVNARTQGVETNTLGLVYSKHF